VRDGVGGVAVRADLEGVLPLDFEQIADLGEHAGDDEVVHRSLPCGRGLADDDQHRRRRFDEHAGIIGHASHDDARRAGARGR
jgi:hypothetical protein